MPKPISRRTLLRITPVAGAALMLEGANTALARPACDEAPRPDRGASATAPIPFHGIYQAGIATSRQPQLCFAAFDVIAGSKEEIGALMRVWSDAAARFCAGQPLGDSDDHPRVPPADSGETQGSGAARLTLTFGFGPSLFLRDGVDRFGLLGRRPEDLVDIPSLPGDALDPGYGGGDICVQACADDAQVALHAIRNLARLAKGVAHIRWMQQGFGHNTSYGGGSRNLFGFKEGANNLSVHDDDAMQKHVWIDGQAKPDWMRNGTYLALRRIRMHVDRWDNSALDEQESSIGRDKLNGAPLGKRQEHEPADLAATSPNGQLLIPMHAHIRLAASGSEHILRRGYSYANGIDPISGELDVGLLFISFQRSLAHQFVPLISRLAENDALNAYTTHTGSAVFACPSGAPVGSFVAETLFS